VYAEDEVTAPCAVPTEPGIYNMLTRDQNLRSVMTVPEPCNIGRGSEPGVLVIDCDDRSWDQCAEDCFAMMRGEAPQSQWRNFFAGLPGTDSMEDGKSYVLVGADGHGSLPFTVTSRNGDDLEVVQRGGRCCGQSRTIMVDSNTTAIHGVGNMLLVPRECKVVSVADLAGIKHGPGSQSDAKVFLMKGAHLQRIKVYSDGTHYQLRARDILSDKMSRKEAELALISNFGLTKQSAKIMTGLSKNDASRVWLIKDAQRLTDIGNIAPDVGGLDFTQSYDAELGVPVQNAESEQRTVDQLAMYENEDVYDPRTVTPEVARAAIQSSETGQKEVMDTSVLAGMVKATDMDDVVDKYLGDLLVGEDRLGRLLFMYYWHNDKFAERYGEEEMTELEDTLRNGFKVVGDLVLFLKKKSIEPEAEMLGSDVDLEDSAG